VAYTEKQERNGRTYYYRTVSVREGSRVRKERKYLGSDLSTDDLREAEETADIELGVLEAMLTLEELEFLSRLRETHAQQPTSTAQNRYEAFVSLFTHDSTAIEGNTLTLQETASVIFEGISPGKSLRDVNEVLDHKRAFDHLLSYEGDVTRRLILDLHRLVVEDTLEEALDDQVGVYRTLQVYIRGVDWVPASPEDVPGDMASLLSWYAKNREKVHPVVLALYFHVGFETVHPFVDGNGRVGRLLMNLILHRNGLPMINIPNVQRNRYYEVLGEAQVNGNLRPFIEYVLELYQESTPSF
jgi:Fic family protein